MAVFFGELDLCLRKSRDSCWLMPHGEEDTLPGCYLWEFFRARMWAIIENAGWPGFAGSLEGLWGTYRERLYLESVQNNGFRYDLFLLLPFIYCGCVAVRGQLAVLP